LAVTKYDKHYGMDQSVLAEIDLNVTDVFTRIGLLSDTHGFLDEALITSFQDCDEIWHAGDFGTSDVLDELKRAKPVRGVFGKCRRS
jgi:hypothetical protein